MVAPRSFPRPSVSTSVRALYFTDELPLPFPSSRKTPNHMSPAHHQNTAPPRTLAHLATTVLKSCADAATCLRVHMHQ
eukprot:346705-Pleurochrysis_carterae.AAC.1